MHVCLLFCSDKITVASSQDFLDWHGQNIVFRYKHCADLYDFLILIFIHSTSVHVNSDYLRIIHACMIHLIYIRFDIVWRNGPPNFETLAALYMYKSP